MINIKELSEIYFNGKINESESELLTELLELASELKYEDPTKSLEIAEVCLELSEELLNDSAKALSNRLIGVAHFNLGNYDLSKIHFENAHLLFEFLEDKNGIAEVVGNIGNLYDVLGDYTNALKNYQLSSSMWIELESHNDVAKVTYNIGGVYLSLGDNNKALETYILVKDIYEKLSNKKQLTIAFGSIGSVYLILGEYSKALEHFKQAHSLAKELENQIEIAQTHENIGSVYWSLGEYNLGINEFKEALIIREKFQNDIDVARISANIGVLYWSIGDFIKSFKYYQAALKLEVSLVNIEGIARLNCNIGNILTSVGEVDKGLECYEISLSESIKLNNKNYIADLYSCIGKSHYLKDNFLVALNYYEKGLTLGKEINDRLLIGKCYLYIGETLHKLKRDKDSLKNLEIALEILRDELKTNQGIPEILIALGSISIEKKEFEIGIKTLLEGCNISYELSLKPIQYEAHRELSIAYSKVNDFKQAYEHHIKFHDLKEEVINDKSSKQAQLLEYNRKVEEAERDRIVKIVRFQEQEKILNNILPLTITERLINGENPIADNIEIASVMFMDIVNFTNLSTLVNADQLVFILNSIFTKCDSIMEEYGIEKVKTIGDAYMAVAGAPEFQADHAYRISCAALSIIDSIKNLEIKVPENLGNNEWIKKIGQIQVRIGLHCGGMIAGVIGEKKFLYDLWGDSVNTASRMESHGEIGKVHISEDFYNELLNSDKFNVTNFESRGEIDIKGKGLMRTYFLIDKTNS